MKPKTHEGLPASNALTVGSPLQAVFLLTTHNAVLTVGGMEPETDSLTAAGILNKYRVELARLEAQAKGLEKKIESVRAKVEAADEIVTAQKAAATQKKGS